MRGQCDEERKQNKTETIGEKKNKERASTFASAGTRKTKQGHIYMPCQPSSPSTANREEAEER
jgi:hypothetical protein